MRFLVVGDSDSYIKWGAALASTLPESWDRKLYVLESPVLPSTAQLASALKGTDLTPAHAVTVSLRDLARRIEREKPDAVLAAVRGPVVRVIARAVRSARAHRPVLLSGLPGITIPAAEKAITYRANADMVVLHSRREVREFAALAAGMGSAQSFGLATLPFLAKPEPLGARAGGDIIFAAQAIVPRSRPERLQILGWLAECARRHPHQRVVVKVRAAPGEQQTHAETWDFASLLDELSPAAPGNLVVAGGPMAEHLAAAAALVTVSSTAAVEAVAVGIPVLLIDDFGVSPKLINTVFEGSGLFGGSDDLINARFHEPRADWLDDNYLHGVGSDDWVAKLELLAESRQAGTLAWRVPRERVLGGALRLAWDRKKALGSFDTSVAGYLALVIGIPARGVVRWARRLRGPADPAAPARSPSPSEPLTPAAE